MDNQFIFNFNTDISRITIPEKLNNPFGNEIPEIVRIAAKEFQEFISLQAPKWDHDFIQNGKMFGILVVQKIDQTFGYLGTISGELSGNIKCTQFVPSIFHDSDNDFFLRKGMLSLSEFSNKINASNNPSEISELKQSRKLKSHSLQQQLFEKYSFLNNLGVEKKLLQIFKHSNHGHPPSAAGECAGPKLLQHAFENNLKPIALAEFWWGNLSKNKERKHLVFYPSCKNKCRPILEYMLDDSTLFEHASNDA